MIGREPSNKAKLKKIEGKLLQEMTEYDPGEPEWETAMTQLERVNAIQVKTKKSIDPNTIVMVAGNLMGILVIVAYEQKHVFTSKGLSQLFKAQR